MLYEIYVYCVYMYITEKSKKKERVHTQQNIEVIDATFCGKSSLKSLDLSMITCLRSLSRLKQESGRLGKFVN